MRKWGGLENVEVDETGNIVEKGSSDTEKGREKVGKREEGGGKDVKEVEEPQKVDDDNDYGFSEEILGACDFEVKRLLESKEIRKSLWGLLKREKYYNFIYFEVC
jgi:hypothetical protein